MNNKIDSNEVAKRYNSLDVIIDEDDLWHLKTQKNISAFIHKSLNKYSLLNRGKILNAGSAGYSYEIDEARITHIDIADKHLLNISNSIVGNIEDMPFEERSFNLIICVGSVLNYCDPINVLREFNRVLDMEGYLIIEFENSKTLELLFKKNYNNSSVFIETFFDAHGDREKIWYFSETLIAKLAQEYNFIPLESYRFHILSPLIYRLTNKSNFSAKFSSFDTVLRLIPGLNKNSSNVIFLFQKKFI